MDWSLRGSRPSRDSDGNPNVAPADAPLQWQFACHVRLNGSSAATEDQAHHEQHQEHHEQDLSNRCGSASDAAESQKSSDQSNDEKDSGPVKHGFSPLTGCEFRTPGQRAADARIITEATAVPKGETARICSRVDRSATNLEQSVPILGGPDALRPVAQR
jgi:hypothetical protein